MGGSEIVFSSRRAGAFTILGVPATGATRASGSLAQESRSAELSRWARLAWGQAQDDSYLRSEIRGTPPQLCPEKLITSTMGDATPQYSPDGEKIVFGSIRSGTTEIWVCDREGENPLQLTTIGGPSTGTPRWSPDGRWIAFDSRMEGNRDICVVSSQGGSPRRLTKEPSEDTCPSWSRDGRYVYFGSSRSTRPLGLSVIT